MNPFEVDGDGQPVVVFEKPTCPLPTVPARIWALFDLYRFYRRGVMYTAGGIADQPHRYLEAMELIEKALQNG